jgi:hypothetical protein
MESSLLKRYARDDKISVCRRIMNRVSFAFFIRENSEGSGTKWSSGSKTDFLNRANIDQRWFKTKVKPVYFDIDCVLNDSVPLPCIYCQQETIALACNVNAFGM